MVLRCKFSIFFSSLQQESNLQPSAYKADALPVELKRRLSSEGDSNSRVSVLQTDMLPLHHPSVCRSRKSRTLICGFGDRHAAIAPCFHIRAGKGLRTLDLRSHIPALLPTELCSPYHAEPRGIEPRSSDFQSDAYTTSAKAPFLSRRRGSNP